MRSGLDAPKRLCCWLSKTRRVILMSGLRGRFYPRTRRQWTRGFTPRFALALTDVIGPAT